MKRGGVFIFLFSVVLSVLIVGIASAQETGGNDSNNKYADAQLERGAGITPDSNFYFIEDSILSKFRDDLANREKKIAEIREMVKEGKIEEAKIALERYNTYADSLEKEVDPAKKDEAQRSAAAIRNAIKEIESQIPESDKKEFVDNVLDKEKSISTAAEIAGKIKDLCEQLSGLDPLEYSRVCSVGGDSPNWQKKLDKKLTAEQREEAKKFGAIMSECFKTAGQQCKCEEIPFPDFASACSIAAPLATACEIKGDEKACEEMDNLKMPELPPHLQDIMDELENNVGNDKFDLHMPKECKEAGATDKDSCFKVMFKLNAPEECVAALDKGEISVSNEREAREKCEEIMFKANAPEECVAAGLKDPKECGKLMFKTNAPQECVDAGITGENRNDPKKCEEIMKGLRGEEGQRGEFEHGGFGGNCKEIKDSEERLKCYDGATQGVKNFDERYRETKDKEKQCAESCLSKQEAWDFSNGQCTCRAGEQREYNFDQRREDRFRPPEGGEFGRPREGFDGREFSDEERRRFEEERRNFRPPEGQQGQQPFGQQPPIGTPPGGQGGQQPGQSPPQGTTTSGEGTHEGTGTTGGSGSTTSSTGGGSPTTTSGGAGITGGVIQVDNRFFDYFFGK